MAPLHEGLRRGLERQVIQARELAERGADAALTRLAVPAKEPHGHLTVEERALRNRLRTRGRAIGDRLQPNGGQEVEHLLEEVAYEAWHRMLFARFLAENQLLVHPEHAVPVSLAECEELAAEEGAEDKWVLASRYAARMLPQIFRPEDPALQVSFAPEHRIALEQLLEALPREVFIADDSLGWVYQFWQSEKKREVNAAGEPITGETLPAVTQLFTEPYMVSFLLENTIGAWWSARHPGERSPIGMPYLRRLEDGTPAAGSFDGWPRTWSEFSMLDPCCGSGHFLVAALRIIVPLRSHDERLSPVEAVDAVLRENLYGLELDPRCTQIAAFALALAAWTTDGATGHRPLPELQIACTGLAVGAKKEEWLRLAMGNQKLSGALARLYDVFKLAPELGSLIDPNGADEDLLTANFGDVKPLLETALQSERVRHDEQLEATAVTAQGIAKAANLLAAQYTLIATNVPYLGRGLQGKVLREYVDRHFADAKADLATAFVARCLQFCKPSGNIAVVSPQLWLGQSSYRRFRERLLKTTRWDLVARLGTGAFETISGQVVNVVLLVLRRTAPGDTQSIVAVDALAGRASDKAKGLRSALFVKVSQRSQLENPDSRVTLIAQATVDLLGDHATSTEGLSTGDRDRFVHRFWEQPTLLAGWERFQGAPAGETGRGGRSDIIRWENGSGALAHSNGARVQGHHAWGKPGVLIGRISAIRATMYDGGLFDKACVVLTPKDPNELDDLVAYAKSAQFEERIRELDKKIGVATSVFEKIPFRGSSRKVIVSPELSTAEVTSWRFQGDVQAAEFPLQVAVAHLLAYRWPMQPEGSTRRDLFADTDGIVCLPAVRGETQASDRLNAVLATAHGSRWSPEKRDELLAETGFAGKTLDDWLRDGFFEQHTKLFHQRPFIWHITDKAKGGFSALVNYHKLDHKTLEALTYTYLGDWIARQEEARKRNERGADVRLAAAKALQEELELILEGEPPYDIFVRWKPLDEQPIGWEPDLNDGVRINIWPFIQAGVLRSKVNLNWNKDRGKNPEGSYWGENRYNRYEDIPPEERPAGLRNVDELTNDVKRRARAERDKDTRVQSGKKPAATRR